MKKWFCIVCVCVFNSRVYLIHARSHAWHWSEVIKYGIIKHRLCFQFMIKREYTISRGGIAIDRFCNATLERRTRTDFSCCEKGELCTELKIF